MTLRLRLLLAFAFLTVLTAAAVSGAGYVRAREAIVQRAQDNAVIETTNRVEQLYPLPARPVDTATLERVAARVSGRAAAIHVGDRVRRRTGAQRVADLAVPCWSWLWGWLSSPHAEC